MLPLISSKILEIADKLHQQVLAVTFVSANAEMCMGLCETGQCRKGK